MFFLQIFKLHPPLFFTYHIMYIFCRAKKVVVIAVQREKLASLVLLLLTSADVSPAPVAHPPSRACLTAVNSSVREKKLIKKVLNKSKKKYQPAADWPLERAAFWCFHCVCVRTDSTPALLHGVCIPSTTPHEGWDTRGASTSAYEQRLNYW